MLKSFYVVLLSAVLSSVAFGQAFNSGSNGSDGAFDFQANDPRVIAGVFTWDPVRDNLDKDGDNVYHFTTFHIPQGVTVRVLSNKTRKTGPVYFLATGLISIEGTLDLSGQDGHPATQNNFAIRIPAIPGPGGYPGAIGHRKGSTPEAGAGPGGGIAQDSMLAAGNGCPASHAAPPTDYDDRYDGGCKGRVPAAYGTSLLLPLVGGTGGSGGISTLDSCFGGGGGAGAGAIRIVSSTEVRFGGVSNIRANGGHGGTAGFGCGYGGSGSGGSIHLQAPLISSPNGSDNRYSAITASGQADAGWASSNGRIRFDATNYTSVVAVSPNPATGPLVNLSIAPLPSITVVSVNGTAAPTNPLAGYSTPDLSINSTSSVAIVVQAANIPANSTVKLRISSEGASSVLDQELPVTLNSQLQATANVTFPSGVSRFYVRAIW